LETLPLVNRKTGKAGLFTACFVFDRTGQDEQSLSHDPPYKGEQREFSKEETNSGPLVRPGETVTFSTDLADHFQLQSGKEYGVQWDGRNSIPEPKGDKVEFDNYVRFKAP
jgi:hypothetical protein